MALFSLPDQGWDLPGWFGKLPGTGDFAQRRLSPCFVQVWDAWLQHNLFELRNLHEDWSENYLQAPVWHFRLGADLINANEWIGILMPSVDSVGRYFPLTLAVELLALNDDASDAQDYIQQWWSRSSEMALRALEGDQDAASFDTVLSEVFKGRQSLDAKIQIFDKTPAQGYSLWLANHQSQTNCVHEVFGLPKEAVFNGLFGSHSVTL
jgi:type VI secretion system protein ImpM